MSAEPQYALPPPGVVEVWNIDLLRVPERLPDWASMLDDAERARGARFRFDEDRDRYAFSHAALRWVLARTLGVDAQRVRYETGEHGKPRLTASRGLLPDSAASLEFNLAHSGDRALVALAVGHPVGVDVERVQQRADLGAVVDRFFSPAERQEWRRTEESERLQAFFSGWTRKEALVKGTGRGLATGIDRFSVRMSPDAHRQSVRVRDDVYGGDWLIQTVPLPEPYYGAVAARGTDWTPEFRVF